MKYDAVKQAKLVGKHTGPVKELPQKRVAYNLNEQSVVFDLGGYDGLLAQSLIDKYKCFVHVFEPLKEHYETCLKNLDSEYSEVYHYGLAPSDEDQDVIISIEGDASSMFSNNTGGMDNKKTEACKLRSFSGFMNEHSGLAPLQIDLLKMNIEGAEFDLIDFILDNGYMERFDNIQIQFHEFMPDPVKRRNSIRERLSETHEVEWDYAWVLESWKRKNV